MRIFSCILLALFILSQSGCMIEKSQAQFVAQTPTDEFKQYWYAGKAELSSYDLQQSRYGEIHPGEATLIFVTEDFSASKQVKLDRPDQVKDDAVNVLKLNFVKKFHTGIYPYSTMSSVFTPVNSQTHSQTLKVTTSAQEWCGHVFMQLNLTPDRGYRFLGLSYFESEGDEEKNIQEALLEDEIWNRIRLNPLTLPTGTFDMIPGTLSLRLTHKEVQAVKAKGELKKERLAAYGEAEVNTYTLSYEKPTKRSLKIVFETQFPFAILGWEETSTDRSFGPNASEKVLVTKAVRKKSIMLDYWSKHNLEHRELQELLK